MNILVHGAGALGAYFGGRLMEAGENVSFFVRERRAKQLTESGLRISSPEGDFETKEVPIYTAVNDVKDIDLIMLAVKGYHLEEALKQVEQMAKQTGAFVLPMLNGMEHVEKLQQSLGKEKILGGFVSIIATLDENGHVLHTNGGSALKFGSIADGQEKICTRLEEVNGKVQTNLLREADILKHMWNKYIFITSFSGITSAMQQPAGFIAAKDATFQVARKIMFEMKHLAEREGVHFSDQEVEAMAGRLKNFHPEATSSMHQDLRKGLPIEVEHLHGGALRLAEKYDVAVPVIETIYGILQPYAGGRPGE